MTQEIREGANIVSAAGYLLAPTVAKLASQFPNVDFTITDDSVAPDGRLLEEGVQGGRPKFYTKNIEGLVYASNQSGCLVGYLAGEMVKAKGGKQVIGAVGGIEIPAVDDYIVGYNYCAKLADPGIKVLVAYSNDFVAQDKCKAVAQNQIGQGSQVEFQVAGGCGLGALNAAAGAGIWGIGVDVDQYSLAKSVLTSALKRVDTGIYDAIKQAKAGQFKGGTDLLFDLNNNGVGVGKISPQVPAAFVTKMNQLEAKIKSGTGQGAGRRRLRPARPPAGREGRPDLDGRRRKGTGVRARPRFRGGLESPRWRTRARPSSSCGASRSATRGSSPTTTSTSTCAAARCTRCSARTAPASRR